MNGHASLNVEEVTWAINLAQSSTHENLPERVRQILKDALREIWRSIQAHPNSYVMTKLEYRVFNYYQAQFLNNDIARRAKKRYWQHTYGTEGPGGVDGHH